MKTTSRKIVSRWLFSAGLAAGALALVPAPARALDIGGLAKKAEGGATSGARDAAVKKVNAKLLAEGHKDQCSFKKDSDELDGNCDKKLKNLAGTLVDVKKQLKVSGVTTFKFEVSGHTDSVGKPEHNKELSGKRAATIARELTTRGVAPGDIISVGMGSERPLVTPDNTEAKRKKNRRYEIQVRF
jgi:OOP family OmpA-OmpF porin